MRTHIILILLMILLSSCFTGTKISYTDPNYLESNEFNETNIIYYTEDSTYNKQDSSQYSYNTEDN